jgi:uncharacterized protein
MSERTIYNCHIHTFTINHVPQYFLKLLFPNNRWGRWLGNTLSRWVRYEWFAWLFVMVARLIRRMTDDDILEREARFLTVGNSSSQAEILQRIQDQYPRGTRFVVLPMDMTYTELGALPESIDEQHRQLLDLAQESNGTLIPFYAVDPRRPGIVDLVYQNLSAGKFRGIKIYPNLGYQPQCEILMDVYEICQERGVPVMTHCSAGGVWKYGLSSEKRVQYSHPRNYAPILKRFPDLRLCLAHFGGDDEWRKHLQGRSKPPEHPWIKQIGDMIRCGDYPNLYTDISYTAFAPRYGRLYFDFFDYLKVLLANEQIRTHVLFGSDFYMVERESLSEKEVSIVLRSRLGEELYFQIAHDNAKRYLGISEAD